MVYISNLTNAFKASVFNRQKITFEKIFVREFTGVLKKHVEIPGFN